MQTVTLDELHAVPYRIDRWIYFGAEEFLTFDKNQQVIERATGLRVPFFV